eukprot:CAMPEP_0202686510 /NCGR_PEP_ID=MMETSP1385-20130828/2263_1 /ASSEMBLY_ACC=CAM_ASM_000861 /TAXON_ID=933848 /ORGANISM="Elphidium margaritaceum" /LENGTH=440 /DNA_ID=CAMNT_0049341095 /DNA_START=150 /DNA_END=1472 /DNA_ORIENTATION=+
MASDAAEKELANTFEEAQGQELADYEEDDQYEQEADDAQQQKEADNDSSAHPKGSYATLASSSFKDFMLRKELMRAIGDAGFEHPSEVQHSAIPKAILGQDMIVQAKSGMGKTAVFVLATLAQVQPEKDVVDTLVLCHTREMASQIFGEFERFSKYMEDVRTGVVYGGIPFLESKRVIEQDKPHVLIGTPGRIVHLLESNVLKLHRLKRFIIDECDNMLDQVDMRRQVQDIFKRTPHSKQVMMFSATIGEQSKSVCRKFTKNAQEIFVDDKQLTLHGLQQHFVKLSEREKNRKLNDLLDALDFNQVVVFVKTKSRATQLNRLLASCAFPSICVHSDMPQASRLQLFKEFKEYKHRILVSTNLFGRGVDIERVNIVINYDMPQDSDEYLHRVGRAGRFGTKGLAITFMSTAEDQEIMNKIQERFKVKVTALPNEIQTSDYM